MIQEFVLGGTSLSMVFLPRDAL